MEKENNSIAAFGAWVQSRHPGSTIDLTEGALGLASEAGEVAQLVRKHEFEGAGLRPGTIALELGDVIHYLALVAAAFDLSLEDLVEINIKKLAASDRGRRDDFELFFADWQPEKRGIAGELAFIDQVMALLPALDEGRPS